MDRRRQETQLARFERTKAEIAARISPVCATMSRDDFDALVRDMAEVEIKYRLRRSADLFPEVVEWELGTVDVT